MPVTVAEARREARRTPRAEAGWRPMAGAGQGGTTFVELSIVVVLLAALAVGVYPLVGNVRQLMALKGASAQLASAIRLARQYAITGGRNHCIEFSASPATSYRIRQAPDVASCTGAVVDGWTTIANGAAVTSPAPAPTMIFDPMGNVRLPSTTPVAIAVDTQPASCLTTVTITLYGGVRVDNC